MDKRVDKGEDFRKSGMTLITEIDSERYLRKAKKASRMSKRAKSSTIRKSGQTDSAVSKRRLQKT